MSTKKEYKLLIGSRAQVMHGTAKKTGGGLRKKDLKYNKHGKIVSKKASKTAKKNNNLLNRINIIQKGGDDKTFYILFVRHCHACHNISNRLKKLKAHTKESYCTNKGLKQSFAFGKNLNLIVDKIKNEILGNKNIGLKFFSSYLQRAIITSYMIQLGYYGNEKSRIDLNVIDGLTELTNGKNFLKNKLQKPNFITRERFESFKTFFEDKSGIKIKEFINNKNIVPKRTTKKNINENFESFLNVLENKINEENKINDTILPVVVGHSQYIQSILNLNNKLDNLDAVLIKIKKGNNKNPSFKFSKEPEPLKYIKLSKILKNKTIVLNNELQNRDKKLKVNNNINVPEFTNNLNIKCNGGLKNNQNFKKVESKESEEKIIPYWIFYEN